MITWEQKSYSDRREAARGHVTFAPIIVRFFGLRFPYDFLKIECDHGLRRRIHTGIHTGIIRFLVLAFFDVLSQNCLEIVGKTKGLRTL